MDVVIGILRAHLCIVDSNSLKSKRMVLQSVKMRLRSKFNVSVAEIADQDKWQRSSLAVVNVGNDKRALNSALSNIVNFLDTLQRAQLLNHELEII